MSCERWMDGWMDRWLGGNGGVMSGGTDLDSNWGGQSGRMIECWNFC